MSAAGRFLPAQEADRCRAIEVRHGAVAGRCITPREVPSDLCARHKAEALSGASVRRISKREANA